MAIENELIAKQSAHIFIDEFVTRIGVVIIAILISSLFWINYVDNVLTFLVGQLIPCDIECANLYDPYAWTKLRWIMAFMISFIPLIPLSFYQTYRFLEPSLFLREKKYLIRVFISTLIIGVVSIVSTVGFFLPSIFTIGHDTVLSSGFEPNYDTILLIDFAMNIIWLEVIVTGYVSVLILAGGLNLINDRNIGNWRWVLFSSFFFLILLTTNLADYGLQWLVLFAVIILLEGLIRRHSDKFSTNLRGLKPVLDVDYKERKLVYVDCMCSGLLPATSPLEISPIGEIKVFNLCESSSEREILIDNIAFSNVTDLIISGCNGTPLPAAFKASCSHLGCQVNGLNFLDINNMRIKDCKSNASQKILLLSEFINNIIPNIANDWSVDETLEVISGKFGDSPLSNQVVHYQE